jgi:hypothetical protein
MLIVEYREYRQKSKTSTGRKLAEKKSFKYRR